MDPRFRGDDKTYYKVCMNPFAPLPFLPAAQPPVIMGVLNVTPDSFSDGGRFLVKDKAVEQGLRLMDEGAALLDIGGESTRFIFGAPKATPISQEEEQSRVMPVLEALAPEAKKRGVLISIDTFHAATMRRALEAGAAILNDVTALTHEPESMKVAVESKAPVILMHMQRKPEYKNVVQDVFDYLKERIDACVKAGISKSLLVADPGIGFGKTPQQSAALLSATAKFHELGVPLLIGASRKSFINALAGPAEPGERLPGSIAAALFAAQAGAQILRVHDVKETHQALKLWRALHLRLPN
jgi:dihydropteroate synthase